MCQQTSNTHFKKCIFNSQNYICRTVGIQMKLYSNKAEASRAQNITIYTICYDAIIVCRIKSDAKDPSLKT